MLIGKCVGELLMVVGLLSHSRARACSRVRIEHFFFVVTRLKNE